MSFTKDFCIVMGTGLGITIFFNDARYGILFVSMCCGLFCGMLFIVRLAERNTSCEVKP